jgi:hypothetical protein
MAPDPPLFLAGFHDVAFDQLNAIFREPFPASLSRPRLLKGLEDLLLILRGFPLNLEIWIDGSFSTKKEDPADIDLLILAEVGEVNSLSPSERQTLHNIVVNKPYIKTVVEDEEGRIHLVLHLPIEEERESRWCFWRPDGAGCWGRCNNYLPWNTINPSFLIRPLPPGSRSLSGAFS